MRYGVCARTRRLNGSLNSKAFVIALNVTNRFREVPYGKSNSSTGHDRQTEICGGWSVGDAGGHAARCVHPIEGRS